MRESLKLHTVGQSIADRGYLGKCQFSGKYKSLRPERGVSLRRRGGADARLRLYMYRGIGQKLMYRLDHPEIGGDYGVDTHSRK